MTIIEKLAKAVGLAIFAFLVFFIAGSTASSLLVGILAAVIFCAPIVTWRRLRKQGRVVVALACIVAAAAVSVYAVAINRPVPLPADRIDFVGTWTAGPAFTIQIHPTGIVRIDQDRKVGDEAWKQLGIEVALPHIETANVVFEKNQMNVWRPMYEYGRIYTIDKAPFTEGGRRKMVLNGIELVAQ